MQPLTYGQLIRGKRDFRHLLAGQFVSELGSWFNFIAVLGLVRVMSDASPIAAGIIFVCRLAPLALLAPIAGGLADRFSRRQIMLWTDLARAAVALLPLLIVSRDDLWIAYIATVLLSAFSSFFDGAKNAATPNLTGSDGLLAGMARLELIEFTVPPGGARRLAEPEPGRPSEAFVYVVSGAGRLEAGDEVRSLDTGDLIGLRPSPAVLVLLNPGTERLVVLFGRARD